MSGLALLPAKFAGEDSYFGGSAPLPESAGWAIVLGFGVAMTAFTMFMVELDKKYVGTKVTSEFFNTAGRSVKTGLTASVIVSQWTWAATLLQSSNVAWQYGVSGPFWYASGATIQVLLFGVLAIELKRKAPKCHTVCELVDARWGPTAHKVFIFFCFLTNVIVSSMLILGGSATMNALTGMNINWASFLIPLPVIFYTLQGGLKATFLASYIHTAVIFLILVTFCFTVYVKEYSSDIIWMKLQEVVGYSTAQCECIYSDEYPACWYSMGYTTTTMKTFFADGDLTCGHVANNDGGSYLTMNSMGGLMFGIINIVGNFGTVFCDQSYWQSAIAAKPAAAHKGYLLGGLVWFTIPFSLATSMGLASLALQLPINAGEAGSGLVPPAVAHYLFGNAGAVLIAVMLFMAIVSTGSAECIAVSSLFSYDIYRKYLNPSATGEELKKVSRYVIAAYGLFMGVLAVGLNNIPGINLGWVYCFMGTVIGAAVYPLWTLLTDKNSNGNGAIAAAVGGTIIAVISWFVACVVKFDGVINVANLGAIEVALTGNVAALFSSFVIHTVAGMMAPQNYDFVTMKEITMVEDDQSGLDPADYDDKILLKAREWVVKWGFTFSFVMVVVWPALAAPAGVFTKGYFAFWIFVALAWGFVATAVIIVLPLQESMDDIMMVCFGIMGKTWVSKSSLAAEEAAAAAELLKSAQDSAAASAIELQALKDAPPPVYEEEPPAAEAKEDPLPPPPPAASTVENDDAPNSGCGVTGC